MTENLTETKSNEKDIEILRKNLKENIEELEKGQKVLQDAIKLLKLLDEIN